MLASPILNTLNSLTPDRYDAAVAVLNERPDLAHRLALAGDTGWAKFVPRKDQPTIFDEQASFVFSRDPVSFLIGGNGSGTTEAAAHKIGMFVLQQQPPPRANTPFWVISNTYEQVCGVLWAEKLFGHGHIPVCEVDYDNIRWLSSKMDWPLSVPLKPWPGRPGKNWLLEFKSYEQGRRAMQARSIGGFCFSEQFPWQLFVETVRGCREYMFPGGQFAEFTPIEPELCIAVGKAMDNPQLRKSGWKFYRCSTKANRPNLAEGWFDQFFATVPDELVETRMTGALAIFEGCIYQSFNSSIHVVDDTVIRYPFVSGAEHYRGADWGSSVEHPFACVWGYRDGMGDWKIYDEYWCADQGKVLMDHAIEIEARSLCWGWPEPDFFEEPKDWQVDFVKQVRKRAKEMRPNGTIWLFKQQHRDTFGDPSRPDCLTGFTNCGIRTSAASNSVYKGIDCVRSLLKVNPLTGKAKIAIHRRCEHLIEELRKYRWMQSKKDTSGRMLNPKVAAPVPLKRDDDTVDALRYMLYSAERSRGISPATGSTYHNSRSEHFTKLVGIDGRRSVLMR
ncbi:hypothetical protein [Trichococcus shcherbakoviae]|uniref:hypothetical protein n=1 Tax=Trichococcus shcherbakoviae TaxID=2094020 RepID=UPI002AA67E43|nr:hypothetical protein [Trichococcus shcherbakoviae]